MAVASFVEGPVGWTGPPTVSAHRAVVQSHDSIAAIHAANERSNGDRNERTFGIRQE